MKIYFITGNKNKLKEAQEIIPYIEGLSANLTEIQSLDSDEIIKHKLEEAKKLFPNKNLIVDDTSLYFECLNYKLPGPFIKFFLEVLKLDGLFNLVNYYKNNKAFVKCSIGLFIDGKIEFFQSVVKGQIVQSRGETNFGWDPIFLPEGYDITYAEMENEKNKISHRKLVLEQLKIYLEKFKNK